MRSKQCIVVGTMPGFEINNRVYSGGYFSVYKRKGLQGCKENHR